MALTKTPVNINFAQGVDTKTDPNQVVMGKMLGLRNVVFDLLGALKKRNGYGLVSTLPESDTTTLTTFNGNLIATGTELYSYNQDNNTWIDKGLVQPVDVEVQSLVRTSTAQVAPDYAIAPNGLSCTVYQDGSSQYYQVNDSATGEQIVARTQLPATAEAGRVYVLGRYFIITYRIAVGGAEHLQYISIPIVSPSSPNAPVDVSTVLDPMSAVYDAYISNNNLYFAYNASDIGGAIRLVYLSSTLSFSSTKIIPGYDGGLVSITADTSGSTSTIWINWWDAGSTDIYSTAWSQSLVQILAPTLVDTGDTLIALTSSATNSINTIFSDVSHTYSYSSVASDFISKVTIDISGTVGTPTIILRSVGLASKSFIYNDIGYVMVAYGGALQPTYFLITWDGKVIAKLAYSNGGGYVTNQVLSNVSIVDGIISIAYRYKDLLLPVNKTQGTNAPGGIYTQTGVNVVKFEINNNQQRSSEIANSLNLTGGMLWQYDGVKPVEQGFHVYPEDLATSTTGTGGLITDQQYYYVATYEWTDNAGNIHRSAPSVPVGCNVAAGTGTSANTVNVPYLRITDKITPNPVRIVIYRWSTAQQNYYQITSITNPVINNPSADSVAYVDIKADSAIIGNPLLYTTGGVIENIASPACSVSTLFKSRLFVVDAEDRNLLWYSKQVIQNTPVEMSDLLTIYVAPTSGAQGSTGDITALSAMDDKLIIFKKDAIYYITGTGPDNAGAQNDFSDPIYITSNVGCDNPNSIALMPNGIMFQSDKGIWLLGRDLSTKYIGSDVESYNDQLVASAEAIPGTNQVRFILPSGTTLMYDYFVNQWGTFNNTTAISACLYQGLHTYMSSLGQIFQERPGTYTDGSNPVLMSVTTAWINLAGLQGYERFYFLYLLGTYYTPFMLSVNIGYDYNPSATQSVLVTPDNYGGTWGSEAQWGSGGPWGGPGTVFEARVFPQIQKCESFQLTINEIFDPSYGVVPGQGLTLSGLNMIIGAKKSYRVQKASKSFG